MNTKKASLKTRKLISNSRRKKNTIVSRRKGITTVLDTKGNKFRLCTSDEDVLNRTYFSVVQEYRYVVGHFNDFKKKRSIQSLHTLIWKKHNGRYNKKLVVDFVDHDRSNCCLFNLRLATRSQNRMDVPVSRSKHVSRSKGVYYIEENKTNPWRVLIVKEGVKHYLGYHTTEEEAAAVYNEAAKKLFGQYADVK